MDVGKVQMFFMTFILIITCGAAIVANLAPGTGTTTEFPPVDEGINVLLGISHIGHISSKAIGGKKGAD